MVWPIEDAGSCLPQPQSAWSAVLYQVPRRGCLPGPALHSRWVQSIRPRSVQWSTEYIHHMQSEFGTARWSTGIIPTSKIDYIAPSTTQVVEWFPFRGFIGLSRLAHITAFRHSVIPSPPFLRPKAVRVVLECPCSGKRSGTAMVPVAAPQKPYGLLPLPS